MKKHTILLLLVLVAQISLAQTFFEYDQAGNRTKRTFTPNPDLFPQLQVSPTTTYGTTSITARLRIIEINGAPTTGPITVKLTKEAHTSFSFNPSATSAGGTAVQNANWSVNNADPNYYTFTSNTGIAGGDLSTIGLSGTVTAGSSPGQLSISMVIIGGSGGETNITNNISVKKIDSFP